jgi:SsrA-binding protein
MKEISNRSALFHFAIEQRFNAGMVLLGTEIKALRQGRANFNDSYCFLDGGELYIKNLHIAEYSHGTSNNHNPVRDRKLLLTSKELRKLETKTKEKGYTIVPLRIYLSENGYAKIEVALAKGKNTYDKRHSIKAKDVARELKRDLQH